MTELSVGLAQLSFEWGAPEENFQKVKGWIKAAAAQDLELLLLPELWASGYDLANSAQYAAPRQKGLFRQMKELALETGLVLGGSLLEQDQSGVYNTFYLYGPDLEAYYRKIHLFRLLEEEKWLKAGSHLTTLTWKGVKMGLATCYDLRFPEMFREYAVRGVELVLLVAEWPESRIVHWQKLLQARAIENQLFLAAVNKVGTSQGQLLGGKSALVDPWGDVVAGGGSGEGLISGEINLNQVEKARRWIPILQDRNPEAYQKVEDASGKDASREGASGEGASGEGAS